MKILQTIFVAFFLILNIDANAQTSRIPLSEKSIVKDAEGVIYPYKKWSPLIKSGDFKLEKTENEADNYLITERKKANEDDNKLIYGNNSNFVGKKIKFSNITDINKNAYSNNNLKDKTVVLNFWFTRCGPCIREIPTLNTIYQRYKDNDNVVFLAVCLDDKATINKLLKNTPFDYNQVANGGSLATQFNISSYPTNIIVQNGTIKYNSVGYNESELKKAEVVLKECLANYVKN